VEVKGTDIALAHCHFPRPIRSEQGDPKARVWGLEETLTIASLVLEELASLVLCVRVDERIGLLPTKQTGHALAAPGSRRPMK
jgi:hypothetical protein